MSIDWQLPTAPSSTASAGGNAGIAAAYAARKLGIPATIVLPEGTSVKVVKRLQWEGAEVQLTGKVRTPRRAKQLEGLFLLNPFLAPERLFFLLVNYAWNPVIP